MIQEYDKTLYKRHDLFVPFQDIPVNGLKLKQCLYLVEKNKDKIKEKYNNTIGTASSVYSPQGIIVARVAKEFGFKSVLLIGNHLTIEKCIENHYNLRLAKKLGCEISVASKLAYNNVLYRFLHKLPPWRTRRVSCIYQSFIRPDSGGLR